MNLPNKNLAEGEDHVTVPHYERLSALDASFLTFEERHAHMHVGSVSLLDAVPFQKKGGGLDFGRIEQVIQQILSKHPRLRQKVWWPAGGPPVWIDDPLFDPSQHFHRVGLPSPGTTEELKQMVSDVFSTKLDRDRPLWECWIVEGVDAKRFAIIWKIHHSLADGISVREILFGYVGYAPSSELPELPVLQPRPAPSVGRLHVDAALQRLEKSRELASRVQEYFKESELGAVLAEAASGFVQMSANLLSDVAPSPLNGQIGPHRRCDWTSCELSVLKDIRKESGAKINDVLLAAVCGAVRRFLIAKKVPVDELAFRVMVPVNMRSEDPQEPGGNRVSNLTIPLPLFETDPRRRLRSIVDTTTRAKASGQSWVADTLLQALDLSGIQMPSALVRLAAQQIPANLIVTNVPGPQIPQYVLESQLAESYSLIPLAAGQGLSVAAYSYNGVMHWGFNADRVIVPDLREFVRAIDSEIQQLQYAHTPIAVRTRAPLRALSGDNAGESASAKPAATKPPRSRERLKQAK